MGNIFDILGPVMVGPSSSHTAGAVRIGMVARQLFGRQPEKAEVILAVTGKGHGTDRALIAGLLGMMPDDMRIPDSYEVAKDMGMDFVMKNKNIKGAHPNTAQIIMEAEGVPQMKIQAHSIGGGRICVCKLDGIDVNFSGESCTLIIRNGMSRDGSWRWPLHSVKLRSMWQPCRYSVTSVAGQLLWL